MQIDENRDAGPEKNPETSDKLTDWKNEPSINDLKRDYEAAKSSHTTMIDNLDRWNDLHRIEGAAKPKKVEGRSQIQPKLIRRQAEWRYPALSEPFLSSNKIFIVRPATFEDAEAARQNELVLNWQFRTQLNRVKFIDDYVRSGVDEGTVFVKTGWLRVTKIVEETVPVYDYFSLTPEQEDEAQMLLQAIELKQGNPRKYDEESSDELKAAVDYYEETGQPVVAVVNPSETRIVEVEDVIENRPDLTIFNPKNVIIDPTCEGDIDKAKFAIFSFETCKADLEKERIYKNLDSIQWESAAAPNTDDHATNSPTDFQYLDSARKRAVAYEYWGLYDIDGNDELVPIVATWIGKTLIRMVDAARLESQQENTGKASEKNGHVKHGNSPCSGFR